MAFLDEVIEFFIIFNNDLHNAKKRVLNNLKKVKFEFQEFNPEIHLIFVFSDWKD